MGYLVTGDFQSVKVQKDAFTGQNPANHVHIIDSRKTVNIIKICNITHKQKQKDLNAVIFGHMTVNRI